MKSTRTRSIVVYILTLCFIFGIVTFLFKILAQGNTWAVNPINEHVSKNGMLSTAGKVTDKNNDILAQNINGERVYNSDAKTRTAMLHTVGDNTKFISTAVQNIFRADLIGYNFVTGIGTNRFLGTGNNIKLTLSSSLCKRALEDFGSQKGAAVLYNYQTGEILCMVSSPSFDPENPPDIKNDTSGKYDGVYLNKGLSSSFTPGSIFKIITCAAAIENIEDIYSRNFYCPGSIEVNGEKINCMQHHGNINFVDGMSLSCNVVFAEIAMELGGDVMTKEAEMMGFNRPLDIDSINLSKSVYDVHDVNQRDLGWSGIGQYTDLVNPMHMAIIMGAIANKGIPIKPYMVEKITTPLGIPTKVGYPVAMDRLIKKETAEKLKDIMRYTVKNNYGDKLFPNLTVCAKTGTAEVGKDKKPHGWMVGFSEDNECPIAFAVVVENSGYGISTAGPIAEDLLQNAYKSIIE